MRPITKAPPVTFFEDEELAQLAERARLDVQGGMKGEPRTKGERLTSHEEEARFFREHARVMRGLAGLRVAARCYALARNPAGLRPIAWGAWALADPGPFEFEVDSASRIATAVKSVGARVLEVPGLAERLARSELSEVRYALAAALPAEGLGEPILRALAADDDASVRQAATKKLGSTDPWGGAFPIPPDGHPDEVLRAARSVLDYGGYTSESKAEEAVAAFAPLSDPLAVACWERVLSGERIESGARRIWLAELLARPGGGAALGRLVGTWATHGHALYTSKALDLAREQLDEPARAKVFAALLEAVRAQAAVAAEQEIHSEASLLCLYLVKHAVAIAPDEGDARPVLETLLGAPITEAATADSAQPYHGGLGKLSKLLERWPLDDALRATLVEMRRAGKPGRWARLGDAVWNRLGGDPVLRENAWRDLDDEDASVRKKAVAALLGPHHDPQDGTVDELARRLYARPELRVAVLRQHEALLPQAQADLEAGHLDLPTALVVLQRTEPVEQTDAMWAAVRALRAQAVIDDDPLWRSMEAGRDLIRQGEPWEPSDLAFARALIDHALSGDAHPRPLFFLIGLLERKEGEESAALLREIDERANTDEQRKIIDAGRGSSEALRAIGH